MGNKVCPLLKIGDRVTSFEISIIFTFFADEKRVVMLMGSFKANLEFSKINLMRRMSRKCLIIEKQALFQFLLIISLELCSIS